LEAKEGGSVGRLPVVDIEDREAVFEALKDLQGQGGTQGITIDMGFQQEFLEHYYFYTPERRTIFELWSNNDPDWQEVKGGFEECRSGKTFQVPKEIFDRYLGLIKQFDKEKVAGLLKEKGLFENDKTRVCLQKEIEEIEMAEKEALKATDTLGKGIAEEIKVKVSEIWCDPKELAVYNENFSKESELLSKKEKAKELWEKELENGWIEIMPSALHKELDLSSGIEGLKAKTATMKREIYNVPYNLEKGTNGEKWGEYKKELQPKIKQLEDMRREVNKKYVETKKKYNERVEELDRALEKVKEESMDNGTESLLVLSGEEAQKEREELIVQPNKEIENQRDLESFISFGDLEEEQGSNHALKVRDSHADSANEKAQESPYEEVMDPSQLESTIFASPEDPEEEQFAHNDPDLLKKESLLRNSENKGYRTFSNFSDFSDKKPEKSVKEIAQDIPYEILTTKEPVGKELSSVKREGPEIAQNNNVGLDENFFEGLEELFAEKPIVQPSEEVKNQKAPENIIPPSIEDPKEEREVNDAPKVQANNHPEDDLIFPTTEKPQERTETSPSYEERVAPSKFESTVPPSTEGPREEQFVNKESGEGLSHPASTEDQEIAQNNDVSLDDNSFEGLEELFVEEPIRPDTPDTGRRKSIPNTPFVPSAQAPQEKKETIRPAGIFEESNSSENSSERKVAEREESHHKFFKNPLITFASNKECFIGVSLVGIALGIGIEKIFLPIQSSLLKKKFMKKLKPSQRRFIRYALSGFIGGVGSIVLTLLGEKLGIVKMNEKRK
jgi:hypothetical protein